MAEEHGIKSLKLQNRRKTIFYPTDWIAGVDYEVNNNDNDNNDDDAEYNDNENNNEYADDDAIDDEEHFDRVDQQEVDELLADNPDEQANPNDAAEVEAVEQQPEAPQDDVIEEPE